ncbi:MAG: SpoIIE family protein phosphatase [Balneolaceae bacterium]
MMIAISVDELRAQETFFTFPDVEPIELHPDMMMNDEQIIYIEDRWRFHPGDQMEWASPDFDDSDWSVVSTNLTETDLSFIDWTGIGWFRMNLIIHEDLRGKPLALIIDRHLGASEIYLNGIKTHELGSFSTVPYEVTSYSKEAPITIVFSEDEIQTIAIRFINPNYAITGDVMGYNGFRFQIGQWSTYQNESYSYITSYTGRNMFYAGLLVAFSLFHILLFVFNRNEKRNLYFSLFVGLLALFSYLLFKVELSFNTIDSIQFFRFLIVTEILVLTFAARFTHSIDKAHTPIFANMMLFVGLVLAIVVWFNPGRSFWFIELAILLYVIEILRSLAMLFYRNRGAVWLLGSGVLVFLFLLIYRLFVTFDLVNGNIQNLNMIGSGFLVLSMSIYLSRDFAVTQKNLEMKLDEVQDLSKKTIEQERISKEREIERRLLEAENNRKTTELEEARALQLSMLPQKMPTLPHYEIAVFMETATEVGGDYYDYSLGKNGELVFAMGDATGHGMKAGIMVAAAKSYFHSMVHESDCITMLRRMSAGLRNMNMRMMYMGLSVLQCEGEKIEITTAGMPPILHFKKFQNCVDRITLKGLPLGTNVEYPYESRIIKMEPGDLIMVMSDGLTELFSPERELFGIERVEEMLKSSNGYSVNDMINQIKQVIKRWSGENSTEDDISVMILKYLPQNTNGMKNQT